MKCTQRPVLILAATAALMLCAACVGAELPAWVQLPPKADLERYRNIPGPRGDGSCGWASVGLLCLYHGVPQGQTILDDYRGGTTPPRIMDACRQLGIPMRLAEGPQGFLELERQLQAGKWIAQTWTVTAWCLRCRRWEEAYHLLNVVGISPDRETWAVLDNNDLENVLMIPRDTAWQEYTSGQSWGLYLDVPPPPPIPTRQP